MIKIMIFPFLILNLVFASAKDELINLTKKQEELLKIRDAISLTNRKTFFLSKEVLVEESLEIKKQEDISSLIFIKPSEKSFVKK